jgi:hypothetical protein
MHRYLESVKTQKYMKWSDQSYYYLTFILIALTHEWTILTWIPKQAATIPDAEAWEIAVGPPSRFQLVMSSSVVLGRYRWIVIWMQLRRRIIWQGLSRISDCHIWDCWPYQGSQSASVGSDVIVAVVLCIVSVFEFFPVRVLLVCSVWLVCLRPRGKRHFGIAIFEENDPIMLWWIWGPILVPVSQVSLTGRVRLQIAATCGTCDPWEG